MIASFFPLKKLRRNGKYLLFVAILVVAALAVYHEIVAANAWRAHNRVNPASEGSNWRRALSDQGVERDQQPDLVEDSAVWISSYTPQAWKPEYKGQANLHIFEDWCGSSTAELRKNLHYPLYPHSRTTVQKLAVSPQWTNYGLRIFGYLHPYTDGEFVFAVSSDDNSEFWLSQDDSPLNLELLAWVGKTGTEWTAPGEYDKYGSQTSRPVWLSAQRKYFFEIIHKQNDRGTDHVAVAWQLLNESIRFMVIDSKHISLYINESTLLMSNVAHIPQTAASHTHTPRKHPCAKVDMLREDPRDTFYHVPLINNRFLQGVLPDCSYKPSYIIKGFPLMRYQGLQFVHLTYIYPNDYTRLTHMETENSCFYHESPLYLKRFGFSRYMRLDRPEGQESRKIARSRDYDYLWRDMVLDDEKDLDKKAPPREEDIQHQNMNNALLPDYGDDYDDYVQRRRRKLFSFDVQGNGTVLKNASDTSHKRQPETEKTAELLQSVPTPDSESHKLQEQNTAELKPENSVKQVEQIKPIARPRPAKRKKLKSVERRGPPVPVEGEGGAKEKPAGPSYHQQVDSKHRRVHRPLRMKEDKQVQRQKDLQPQPQDRNVSVSENPTVAQQQKYDNRNMGQQPVTIKRFTPPKLDIKVPVVRPNHQRAAVTWKSLREREIEMNMPLQRDIDSPIYRARMTTRGKTVRRWLDAKGQEDNVGEEEEVDKRFERRSENKGSERDSFWGPAGDSEEGDEDELVDDFSPPPVFDPEVNWSQTFQVNQLDLQALRSDWIDLRCNISGNLMLRSKDAQPIVKAFMDQLNLKYHGRFTLVRVVNVEKRADGPQGSRYLLELELRDMNGQLLRLSHYIYALISHKRQRFRDFNFQQAAPQTVLCNPVGFRWNPDATVHFIVPVKNQARWVQQLIVDMEELYRETGDPNFNLIITDYSSSDMDVEKALHASKLPRYKYLKLSGNFQRSAGLQAGINLITDDHSIVFLCDLHIHFPHSIVDTIRKHCVEGHMAFAPIVMRLDCGATPSEPRGYWEVNGFGLLGIYKSDLDAAGGMNTKEFTDRWGGEDWELLDRILQSGLEVERIYLRNFFHHYHSKRGMWNRRTLPNRR
ncbi:beta-1,4-N-acetylgalactosaminyltransferase 3 [Myripristis murdjan]|uniref:beta-1,4-N-acetylgalactosaminyltransferase 3 n=1 Tax=Myripristis murdjan TaxID=586833 RepID=UPI001175F304|nr:beta-1,4-N-acetylgalactosaminyltransferase 3 [Myripristis murdjan]